MSRVLSTNERYTIIEDQRALTKNPLDHPVFVYVYYSNYSPNFGWRNFNNMGKFASKQEAQEWIDNI